MKSGRERLEEIKKQVQTIRTLQDRAEGVLSRARKKLAKMVKGFSRAERELYRERINQITKKYL